MLTATSRPAAAGVAGVAGFAGLVPIRAARSVSHRPPARCTRATGGLSSTPASAASSCAATLYAPAGTGAWSSASGGTSTCR
jgi:hypothetical protein